MDNYNSSYYEHNLSNLVYDYGEYSFTPNYSAYNYPHLQDSTTYAYQDFPSEPTPLFFTDYDRVSSSSSFAYSATSYSEPKYIEYQQAPYYHVENKFVVSYSVAALDDTDFEDYDPTPYGGGYDILATYGKPLSPSDKTCYPRHVPNLNSSSLGKDHPEKGVVDESAPKPLVETEPTSVIDEVQDKSSGMDHDEQEEGVVKDHEVGNGYHQVPYVPSGYGLEAMDLCESLFGYWPCLSKIKRTAQDCQENGHCHCGGCGNPWNGTADYLFGSSDPYSSRHDYENFGNAVYGYEKHYHGRNQQVKYVNDPWLG